MWLYQVHVRRVGFAPRTGRLPIQARHLMGKRVPSKPPTCLPRHSILSFCLSDHHLAILPQSSFSPLHVEIETILVSLSQLVFCSGSTNSQCGFKARLSAHDAHSAAAAQHGTQASDTRVRQAFADYLGVCLFLTLGVKSLEHVPIISVEPQVSVLIGVPTLSCSKFFTKPNGTKPAPQQTKLSFASKSADKPKRAETPKQEDEVDVKEEIEEEHETESRSSPGSASTKENSAPTSGECSCTMDIY